MQVIRGEIYQHSDFENPSVNQIRHEELDHAALRASVEKIVTETKALMDAKLKKPE